MLQYNILIKKMHTGNLLSFLLKSGDEIKYQTTLLVWSRGKNLENAAPIYLVPKFKCIACDLSLHLNNLKYQFRKLKTKLPEMNHKFSSACQIPQTIQNCVGK